jgi:phospholipid/cholesterol/gamma-HCH transport system substrate-binding protein
MNLTKAEKARLGVFVATGVGLLVGGLLILSGVKVLEPRDVYQVRFTENVGGLEPSAQVKYQGLRVGRVDSMRIAPDDPNAIEVKLSLEAGTVLRQGTTAVLDTSGLTGLKTINLTPGDPRGEIIAPGSLLPAGKSFFDRITGHAEAIAVKVEMVANQLSVWTGEENRRRMEMTIDNMNRLIVDVDATVVKLQGPLTAALTEVPETARAIRGTAAATTKTLNDAREDLAGTLAELRGTLAETRRILKAVDSKTVTDTMQSASSAMKSLDRRLSSAELGEAIVRIGLAMNELAKILTEMELAVRGGREDFVMSLSAIRQASEDLREFSRIIAQDPSVLLRGKEVQE